MIPSFRSVSIAALVLFLGLSWPAAAQEGNLRALARSWTCHATINLVGTGHTFTPSPWRMRTRDPHTVWGDREASCKAYLKAKLLTPGLWNRFELSSSEQQRICRAGGGRLRVDYGFDKRPKSWNFVHPITSAVGLCPRWTPWLNRDNPSGTGDFETLREFLQAGRVPQSCGTPSKIECRRRGTSQLVQSGTQVNGERFTCDRKVGGYCYNSQQAPGIRCGDYEVRFLCP